MLKRVSCFIVFLTAVLRSAEVSRAEEGLSGAERTFFENRIRPVLASHCYECHSADAADIGGGLLLDSAAGMARGGQSGPVVIAGKPHESLLISALNYDGLEMPPADPLPPQVIADFRRWIRQGAGYPADLSSPAARPRETWDESAVWSFLPPANPAVPKVADQTWPLDPVDHFVLSGIEAAELSPAGDAPPDVLIRRLSYDLTGLPPSVEEIRAFRDACRQDRSVAVRQLVETLLDSPHFGERWGRHWLDVARYGESNGDDGLGRNATFPYAWRYRDYVIDAFNADVPYDRFLQEQIAGDLLPAEDAEQRNRQLTATGFLAIGSKPAAAMNKDFPMDIVDHQIDVISTGVMGLSVACARCHDHKHDPISTRDYYSMAGIFTSTETLYGNAGNEKLTAPPTPLHELVTRWAPESASAELDEEPISLVLSEAYRNEVRRSGAVMAESLNQRPKELQVKAVSFDSIDFATVDGACLSGRLPTAIPSYTVSFWFRNRMENNKRPITAYLFSRGAPGNSVLPGDHIGIGGTHESSRTGKLFVFNGNENTQTLGGTTAIRPGSWNHVLLSRHEDNLRVFLNGNLEIAGVLPATFGDNPDFCLANRSDGFAPLQGNLAEFAIWDRALPEKEALSIFSASGRPRGRRSPGLAMGVREKDNQSDCKIHIGGTSARLGDEVPRGFLRSYEAVGHKGPEWSDIPEESSGRLQLAHWLTDPAHPQTARVMVNRIWQHLFGRGLVVTPDDFGVYGARPSHPELLDHLAGRLIAEGWSVKKFIRALVLSRTYQLDSRCSAELAQLDPDNELQARHSRRRLDAESIRDSILSASGQLNPARPVGSDVHQIDRLINWPPGESTSLHQASNHRSIYLCFLRHDPPAELAAFDLPDGVTAAGKRSETNSPTQSLFLLNNPFVVRQSRLLAERLLTNESETGQQVRLAFQCILRRAPTPSEEARAVDYLGEAAGARLAGLCQALFASNEFRYVD